MNINKLIYTILFTLILFPLLHAQGLKFNKSSYKTLISKAQKKNRILFVDTYASWCAPCKMMERDVFPQKIVGDYYNKRFICIKIDMESPEGQEFSTKHKVESIPSFYYLSGDGKVIYKKTGGTNKASEFVEYGQAAQDIYAWKTKKKEIQQPRSMLHYAYFLKEMADSNYNHYLHQFLKTESDWSSPENMQIILDLAEVEGSPALEYFVTNIDSFSAKMGESAASEKRLLIILDRSIEFLKATPKGQNPDMEKLRPVFKKYFGEANHLSHFLLFQFRYYQQNEDYVNMRLVLRRMINEVVKSMPDGREKAIEYINTAAVFYEAAQGEEKLQAEAIQWGEKAAALHPAADVFSILAALCQDAGYTEKAFLYQQKANEASKKE